MRHAITKLVLLLALAAVPAFPQGCAMCYTSAKGASSQGQKALSRAVLVLLIPTITLIGGFVGLTYKFRGSRQD